VIDPFARYLCLSVDAGGYGRANDRVQSVIQDELLDVLAVAATAAGLDRRRWHRQGQGDGELALIPPSEPEARVVDDFIGELATSLYGRNRDRAAGERLRLRLALDHWLVPPDGRTPSGRPGAEHG
jgi:hypothetical protein